MFRKSPNRSSSGGSRLKRQLLTGIVDDNLRAIRNQPRGRLYRRPPVSLSLLAAVVALAVAGTALWLTLGRPPAERAAAAPDATASSAAVPPGTPAALPETASPPDAPPARISPAVLPLSVHRIVLDPGHGGGDQGTRTPNGLLEKDLTLDIAQRTRTLLDAAGFETELTRDSDVRVSLRERARLANEHRADLFVSIHVNWLEDGRANRGIETYFLGPSDDPFVSRLASAENRESGYSLADARRLLDSIYADLRQKQSRALAAAVQAQLVNSIREVSPVVRDRGIKSAPFLVLVSAEMPAILAEVASVSSSEEARLLTRDDYRDRIAVALSQGIRSYSGVSARPVTGMEAR